MSVVTKNPFAALLGDDEGADVDVSTSSAAAAPAKAADPAAAPAADKPARNVPGAGTRGRGGYYSRGGPRNIQRSGAGGEEEGAPAPEDRDGRGSRGGANRSRGRGRGRGDRPPRGNGRVFDRHSATGKEDSEKKEHQGWGGDDGNRELEAEKDGVKDAADAKKEDQPEEAANEVPAEEVDTTKTLDEYLAERSERQLTLGKEQKAPRQANEGVDDALWKNVVQLQKPEEEAYFTTKQEKSSGSRVRQRKEKVHVEIEQKFPEPPRRGGPRGGGRGGRGGERGSRGGRDGAGRGARTGGAQNANVNLSDERAFPSLA